MLMRRVARLPESRYRLESNGILVYVGAVSLLCWCVRFYLSVKQKYPLEAPDAITPLWNDFYRLFANQPLLLIYAAGFLLMLFKAYLLYRAGYSLMLFRKRMRMPFILGILLLSVNVRFLPLPASSFCFFTFLAAIYTLFASYHDTEATQRGYMTGLFLGISSLFWVPVLWFVPLFWWTMYRFKSLNGKMFSASLFGLGSVYWIAFGWCIWKGDYTVLTYPFAAIADMQPFRFKITSGTLPMCLSLLYCTGLTLLSVFHIIRERWGRELREQRFFAFLMQCLITGGLLLCFYGQHITETLHILCIPASLLVAYSLSIQQGVMRWWMFHSTIVACLILFVLRIWKYL